MKSELLRYINFTPLKDETFIYPLNLYKGKIKGTEFEIMGRKYIEIKGGQNEI